MDEINIIEQYKAFQWDSANANKNWHRHKVSQTECEEVFFNQPILLYKDIKHSHLESRNYVLGKTDESRKLFIVFTIREGLIRVISARDMSRKERDIYEKAEENTEI